MDQRENFVSRLTGEASERTPMFLFDTTLGMEVAGYRTPEVFAGGFDGEKSARSIIALQRRLGHDAVIGSVMAVDGRTFGSEVVYPDLRPPYVKSPAFRKRSDLYRHSPSEADNGSLKEVVRSYDLVRRHAADVAIFYHIPSPFSLSALFRGLEPLLLDVLLEPDFIRDLVRFCSEVIEISMDVALAASDVDAVLISGAYDNVDILGPEVFADISMGCLMPQLRKVESFGLPCAFHPHSALSEDFNRASLDLMLDSPIDCLYYGEGNDAMKLLDACHGKVTLMGGIDTFTTIYLGPDERVLTDTMNHMDLMRGEAHIFSCSCSVDRGLPLDRMKLMADTVRAMSRASD